MFGDSLRRRPLILLVAALAAAAVVAPPASAQSEGDVTRAEQARDDAYARLVDIRGQVADAVTVYDELSDQIFEVSYQLDRLESRISRDRAQASLLEDSARRLLVASYINRTPVVVDMALESDSIQDLVIRQTILDRANSLSVASVDRLNAVSRELTRLGTRFEDDRADLDRLQGEATAALDQVNFLLERAEDELTRQDEAAKEARKLWQAELARKRAEEEARRRAAEARSKGNDGKSIGGLICPQAEPMFFRNDWGNRRSGGRTHKGTDIFGSKGNNVVAVTSGSLRTRTGGLGGTALWLYGNDGHAYYYAHLDGWASGVSTGTRVSQGTVIGYVGNTGNARGGANHTHFEIHPNGGAAINPYWTLAQVCDR